MSGQNVGINRSTKASIGLWGMGKVLSMLSAETLVTGLIKSAKNIKK
jgi:hypothetical protein